MNGAKLDVAALGWILNEARHDFSVAVAIVRVAEGGQILPNEMGRGIAENRLHRRARVQRRPVRRGQGDQGRAPFDERTEASLAVPQPTLALQKGGTGLVTNLDLAKFTREGGSQARELALEHEVVRACAHRIHGRLLSDRAGHDDERDVDALLP
jgi:hypothetical protein